MRERNEHAGTPEYRAWVNMRDRCRRAGHPAYHRYGGRGISVCARWDSFKNFLADVGPRPSPEHSIDRIDNDGDYTPDNCRWTTQRTQNRNQSRNVLLTYAGKTQSVMDWAEETGISHAAISQRIGNLGWSVDQALATPAGKAHNWCGTLHKDAKQYAHNGQSKGLSEWAAETGIPRPKLARRLQRGWPLARALTEK